MKVKKFFALTSFAVCLFFLASITMSWAEDPVKLHLFLHSHLDEGWIYTFEHYYTGTNSQDGGCVRCALNNVYGSLLKNPDRKYQMAEVAFFRRWWSEQPEENKNNIRKLIKDKQFQFINGGWSANDEACTYYEDIIDQFILGNRWLKDQFDVYPNVAWQIDSFGHSATQAALMAQAGYDGFFFGRLDYKDWDVRRQQQSLEVNWRPQNPHNESVFGRALYVHYSDTKFMVADNYYCRSIFCHGRLDYPQYQTLAQWVHMQSASFKTKNVAILIGDDFHLWQEAEKDFDGIEALIQHFKDNPDQKIEAKFSTLNEYVREFQTDFLSSNSDHSELPNKYGDFFPYIENDWTAWVGYFTSKPMFKLKCRLASQYYNAAKLLLTKYLLANDKTVLTFSESSQKRLDDALQKLEDPLAVVQHHDAIAGTMREDVKHDYERMLDTGRKSVDDEVVNILKAYSKNQVGEIPKYLSPIDFDWRQNDPLIAQAFDQSQNVLVNVFNPGEKDKFLIKIKVPSYKYKVLDQNNNYIVVDIICNNPEATQDCFIYFTDVVDAFSLKSYILLPSALSKRVAPVKIDQATTLHIGSQVTLTVDANLKDFNYQLCPSIDSFNLHDLFKKKECVEDKFNLEYEYYESHVGSGLQVSSGAYIFRPRGSGEKITYSKVNEGRIFKGRFVTIVQIFREDLRTDIKLVHHELDKGIEVESFLNSVQNAYNGKEIVVMIRSKNILNNEHIFYTDSNGYYMQKRQIDRRDDFDPDYKDIHIPSNYYPMTSAVYIEDSKTNARLTVMTDRSQGVTSLKPGEVEIMIHRLTVADDWKGLSETLNEVDPDGALLRVSTRHYILYSSPKEGLRHQQRRRQYKLDRPLQLWFANVQADTFSNPSSSSNSTASILPKNVKLYVRSYKPNEYVVRLHNLNEDVSKIATLFDTSSKLCTLLNSFAGRDDIKADSVEELSLFTTKKRSEILPNKLDPSAKAVKHTNDSPDLSSVELAPMEIRTFNIVTK